LELSPIIRLLGGVAVLASLSLEMPKSGDPIFKSCDDDGHRQYI